MSPSLRLKTVRPKAALAIALAARAGLTGLRFCRLDAARCAASAFAVATLAETCVAATTTVRAAAIIQATTRTSAIAHDRLAIHAGTSQHHG